MGIKQVGSHIFCFSVVLCSVLLWRWHSWRGHNVAAFRKLTHIIQVNFTYVKVGGHVSNDLSGVTSDRRKIAWVQNFLACKTEMDRMNVTFFRAFFVFVG